MSYVALYRKWRPQTFEDVVGQKHVSETLQRAIQEDKLAHAYVFAGPRGTGKTSLAKILARAINCEHGPTPHPCNTCTNCQQMLAGTAMDVMEIDAASNRGIDEIRALRESTRFLPVEGRKKIFIIDEAHMLTTEAWNALLKTIEEPPPHILFIFATTEQEKIPVTILSRCQRYTFRRITTPDIASHLAHVAKESDIDLDPGAAQLIAVHADGGLRDALSMLDQCASMGVRPITTETVESMMGLVSKAWIMQLWTHMHEGNGAQVLMDIQAAMQQGREAPQILEALAQHLRALLIARVLPDAEELTVYDGFREVLAAQVDAFPDSVLAYYTKEIQDIQVQAKRVDNPRIVMEMGLLALCARQARRNEDWENRVAVLEDRVQQETERMQNRMAELETRPVAAVSAATVVNTGAPAAGSTPYATQPAVPAQSTVGMTPPGMPGNVTPGTIPPGSTPPGPGTVPPGAIPPGAMPPPGGAMPPGNIPSTRRAPGATPSGAPTERPLSQMPATPTVRTIGVTETGERAVIGEDILPMKEYKPLLGTVLKWMESQKYNMIAAQYKRGQLIYVDRTKAVMSFNSDFGIRMAKREDWISGVREGFSHVLKRPMDIVVVGHTTQADTEYRHVVRQLSDGGGAKAQAAKSPAPGKPAPQKLRAPIVPPAESVPARETTGASPVTPASMPASPIPSTQAPREPEVVMPAPEATGLSQDTEEAPVSPDLTKLTPWDVSKMPEEERNNPLLMKALENLSQDHDIYMEFIEEDE